MNMKKIDGTKKLTIRHFKNLQSALKEDDMLIILVDGIEIGTVSVIEFPTIFSSGTLSELEAEQIIDFVSENVMLSINARDYKKWTNPWWASRIFAKESTQMKIEDVKLIFCCEVFKKKKDTGEKYDSTSFSSESTKIPSLWK